MQSSFLHLPRLIVVLLLFTLEADYRLVYQADEGIPVATGVEYRHYDLDGPLALDVVEIDRNASSGELVAWRSGGLKRTSAQFKDADVRYSRVLAAINADFFSFQTTWPISYQVTDGEFIHATPTDRTHLIVDAEGRILFERPTFAGYVISPDADTLKLNGVNRRRNQHHAVWYTTHATDRVRSDSTGFVFHLKSIGNDAYVIHEREPGYGPQSVVGPMLSIGPETAQYWKWRDLSGGDTIRVWLGFQEPHLAGLRQAIGGGGMILENGQPVTTLNEERDRVGANFMTARHPRTFVAVNQDQSKIWLCTVDGRQEASIGMTFNDMAEFLLSLGAWDALNLDGGGSTAMVVKGDVVNKPSDLTGERAVANVLLFVER
jgi:hypothetical protein